MESNRTDNTQQVRRSFSAWIGELREFMKGRFSLEEDQAQCEEVVKDAEGNVTELRCTYDPMSGGGSSSDGRRVKGVIHWVSARHAFEAEIRLFNPLFTKENPDDCEEGQTWEDNLNPESMIVTKGWLEPSLAGAEPGRTFQFERVGYFCPDTDTTPGHPVFNRTVTLKDSWAKINK